MFPIRLPLIFLLFFAVFSFSLRGQQQGLTVATDETLLQLIKATAELSPQIRSFSLVGRAHLAASDELVRNLTNDKVPHVRNNPKNELNDDTRYVVLSKGVLLKCESTSVNDPKGDIDRYYWDGKHIIWEKRVASGASQAIIADLDGRTPLLTGISGFLAEYAFLRSDSNQEGTPSWLASDLSNWKHLWEDASKRLISGSVNLTKKGTISAQFKMPSGTATVTFKVLAGALFPMTTKLVGSNNTVIMDNRVVTFKKDKKTGLVVATKARALITKPTTGRGTMVMGFVTNELEKFECNPELDDNTLAFDPASVDEIVDHGVSISVPK